MSDKYDLICGLPIDKVVEIVDDYKQRKLISVEWIEKWVRNDPTADPDTFTDMVADWRKENAKVD